MATMAVPSARSLVANRAQAMSWRVSLLGIAIALCGCSSGAEVVEADAFVLRRTMAGPDAPPLAILGRGYAICFDGEGRAVRTAAGVAPGDHLDVRFSTGRAGCAVETVDLEGS